jgi:hypothetical protein
LDTPNSTLQKCSAAVDFFDVSAQKTLISSTFRLPSARFLRRFSCRPHDFFDVSAQKTPIFRAIRRHPHKSCINKILKGKL